MHWGLLPATPLPLLTSTAGSILIGTGKTSYPAFTHMGVALAGSGNGVYATQVFAECK
jgi:hypothetical protein